MLPNYIKDQNRFSLAGPPVWFLRRLWEFDPSLVIVPSRQAFLYRLAQRRKPVLVDQIAYEALREQADTAMLMSYRLVPVTTIIASANWSNPAIFNQLAERAPWRMGGAEAVNQMLDAQDKQDSIDRTVKNDILLSDVAKDGWKYYNKLIGKRTHLYSPKGHTKPHTQKSVGLILPHVFVPTPYVKTVWGRKDS